MSGHPWRCSTNGRRMTRKIDLVYFNAGGGHRAAALAIQEAVRLAERPWDVRLVNLFEVLDPKRTFNKFTGLAPEDLYNLRLKRGWTLGLATELKVLQAMIRMSHATLLHRLEHYWSAHPSDLVVSLVPNFNQALYQSTKNQMPRTPFVTVLTDMADYPPHFWIEQGLDQHIVCGTSEATKQAREAGYTNRQISQTSGMILKPAFYQPNQTDRMEALRDLGFNPDKPTGLVMFGGHGSSDMLRIAKALKDVQLIFLCGHNHALTQQLDKLTPVARHVAVSFTPNVERYMRLGDFFIGKPGPASISEALLMGMPVITTENAWTMPQERFNTKWLRDNGVGLVIPSLRHLRQSVMTLLSDIEVYRSAVLSLPKNTAVFEVVEIMAQQLAYSDCK